MSYEIKTLREDATEAQMYYASESLRASAHNELSGNSLIYSTIIFASSIATFFQHVKSYFIQFITNQLPETELIVPWLRLLVFTGKVVV